MNIRFSLLMSDPISAGTYRTMYETNVDVKSNPAIAILKEQTEKQIQDILGIRPETAEKDKSYSMRYAVFQTSKLGVRVPEETYTLVITDSGSITRLPVEFRLQGIGV